MKICDRAKALPVFHCVYIINKGIEGIENEIYKKHYALMGHFILPS